MLTLSEKQPLATSMLMRLLPRACCRVHMCFRNFNGAINSIKSGLRHLFRTLTSQTLPSTCLRRIGGCVLSAVNRTHDHLH